MEQTIKDLRVITRVSFLLSLIYFIMLCDGTKDGNLVAPLFYLLTGAVFWCSRSELEERYKKKQKEIQKMIENIGKD